MNTPTPKIPSPTERVEAEKLIANVPQEYFVPYDFALTLAKELEASQKQVQAMKEALEETLAFVHKARGWLPSHGTFGEDRLNAHYSAIHRLEEALAGN